MPSPSTPQSREQRIKEDENVRQRIGPWDPDGLPSLTAFEADTNFVVKAAAGSGKTTALVARMTALLRTGAATIDQLAAITFTRKAAAEMKGRFYEELRSTRSRLEKIIQGNEEPPADLTLDGARAQKDRIDQALQSLSRCFIGTVHAFCGRILRENAFAAGLPPDFEVGIEDDEFDALRAKIWGAYTQKVRGSEKHDKLAFYGLTPADVEPLFARLSRDPELEAYTNAPETPPDLKDVAEEVKAFVEKWNPIRPSRPSSEPKKAYKQIGRAAAFIENSDLSDGASQARLLSIIKKCDASNKYKMVGASAWGESGSTAKAEAERLRDEVLPEIFDLIDTVLPAWDACAHRAAVEFAEPAAEKFWKRRLNEGKLTHHDVLFATRELLREYPGVRKQVHKRTPRLLVDEFQDTDPLQAEILFYITNEKQDIETWRDARPAPGSLFIVGDDKQSIYRFRRADINVFEAVVDRVEEAGGSVELLSRNFRSLGNLLTFFNETFPDLFEGTKCDDLAETVQAEYEPFVASREDGEDPTGLRRLDISYEVKDASPTNGIDEEANRIAHFIEDAIDNKDHVMRGHSDDNETIFLGEATPDDFLILTTTKKHIATYAEALAEADVPFTVTNSEDLGASPDLRDLVTLLRFALRPDDPVAGLAYLQSGLAGFSDDDLYRYKKAADTSRPFTLYLGTDASTYVDALGETLGQRFDDALARVRRTRRTVTTRRPGIALLEIAESEGLAAAAATPEDESDRGLRAGRLLAVLERIQRQSGEGATWAEITDHLYDIVQGKEDADSLTLKTGEGNAVRIMNVHQAKGLEAPVVFLAGIQGKNNGRVSRHVRRGQNDTDELVSPVIEEGYFNTKGTHPPLGWDSGQDPTFKDLEKSYNKAERQRLLYVAATRAQNLLVVSHTYTSTGKVASSSWSELAKQMSDVSTLAIPPASDAEGSDSMTTFAPGQHAEHRRERIAQKSAAGIAFTTVSKEKDGKNDTLSNGDGYGKTFGTVVHNLLEGMIDQRDTRTGHLGALPKDDVIRALLPDQRESSTIGGSDDASSLPNYTTRELVQAARRMLAGFRDSDLGQLIATSDTVYTEYPFTSHENSSTGDRPDTLVSGTIDLVYRDADGWHIVDFKTDRVASSEAAETLAPDHAYRDQIRQYADAWEALTGDPVASGSLWFTETGTRVFIDQ